MIMRLGLQTMITKRDGIAEIVIGGAVFLIALGFIFYSVAVTNFDKDFSNSKFSLQASFESVNGIRLGSNVVLAGVKVGSVSKIQLDKESFQAKVTFSLFEDYKLPEDTEAVINSDGLLGGNFISLNVGGSDIVLESGDELLYTQSSVSILNLLSKFAGQ